MQLHWVKDHHISFPQADFDGFGHTLVRFDIRKGSQVVTKAVAVISIRPSWCQDERNIERNLGPLIRDHSIPQEGLWSYIDIYDLANAIVLAAAAGAQSLPSTAIKNFLFPQLSCLRCSVYTLSHCVPDCSPQIALDTKFCT
jgi:hypothetical protein